MKTLSLLALSLLSFQLGKTQTTITPHSDTLIGMNKFIEIDILGDKNDDVRIESSFFFDSSKSKGTTNNGNTLISKVKGNIKNEIVDEYYSKTRATVFALKKIAETQKIKELASVYGVVNTALEKAIAVGNKIFNV